MDKDSAYTPQELLDVVGAQLDWYTPNVMVRRSSSFILGNDSRAIESTDIQQTCILWRLEIAMN